MRSDCVRASSSFQFRARHITRSAGMPWARLGVGKSGGSGGIDQEGPDPRLIRMIQMGAARCRAHDLKHARTEIGVKRVAVIVRGKADIDAARRHFMHQGDAASARGATGIASLQIQVAHRQADDMHHALATRSSVFRALVLDCVTSKQQCPAVTGLSKPVSSTVLAMART